MELLDTLADAALETSSGIRGAGKQKTGSAENIYVVFQCHEMPSIPHR